MFRHIVLVAVAVAGITTIPSIQAGPQYPFPRSPIPRLGVEGPWYFRGDPAQPCLIEVYPGPRGIRLVITNEKGTSSGGRLLGNHVIASDWGGLVGEYRGNAIVWPNGDFWSR